MQNWEHYGKQVEKGPKSAFKVATMAFLMLFGFGVVVSATGWVFGWFGEAAVVAKQEFGPKAMLKKYEWFKNASAELDKKLADIDVYKSRLMVFDGIGRSEMDRTDKEQQAIWQAEVSGVIASYNGLAAEWNAQISKFNWKPFIGDLPPGAEGILRKNYAEYRRN